MSKIDLKEFKHLLPAVKQQIKGRLKVNAGTQSAYDIMAASRGYKDYHCVKAEAEKPYYDLRLNMGNREFPCWVSLEVGHCDSLGAAEVIAWEKLDSCQQFQKWALYRDGEDTGVKLQTAPKPTIGVVYQIQITGKTLSDAEAALDDIRRKLDYQEGFDRNESGSYHFARVGAEVSAFDVFEDLDVEMASDYVLVDEHSILASSDDEGEIKEYLEVTHSDIGSWTSYLAMCVQISLDVLVENADNMFDMATYHAISKSPDGHTVIFSGESGEVLESMKERPDMTFRLYEEMERRS